MTTATTPDSPSPATIYLMDASAYIFRAFFAIRRLNSPDGAPTNAIFGFTATLLSLLSTHRPEYLSLVFDPAPPTRRHALYPQYKANRPPADPDLVSQLAPIRELAALIGARPTIQEGFEADDLIAAYARRFAQEGLNVVIVSGDKDFYQLLGPRISMRDPDPANKSALTQEAFRERFPTLESPQEFLDVQALMGDSSDNIPGVPKVGEKTALKLIGEYRSLDNLYASLARVSPQGLQDRLRANEGLARLSYALSNLGEGVAPDAPLSSFAFRGPPDREALKDFYKSLGFARFLKSLNSDFPPEGAPRAPSRPTPAPAGAPPAPKEDPAPLSREDALATARAFKVLSPLDPSGLSDLIQKLSLSPKIALSVDADSPTPRRARLHGLALCAGLGEAFFLPLADAEKAPALLEDPEEGPPPFPLGETLAALAPPLLNPSRALWGRNYKYIAHALARRGLALPPCQGDPDLGGYLLGEDGQARLRETALAGLEAPLRAGVRAILAKPRPRRRREARLDPSYPRDNALADALLAFAETETLERTLPQDADLEALYRSVELPLEGLLWEMESLGVLVDSAVLQEVSHEFASSLRELEAKIFAEAGGPFNVSSPRQVGEVLFAKLGLPTGKKTAKKTGFSTDSEVLGDLSLTFPIAGLILRHREIHKLKSTYADSLPLNIEPRDGRVHTTFNQALTATGRLSSANPNLQNIPTKTSEGRRIREAFVAPPGARLVSADYSQIELRVMAAFSQDEALLRAFANDEDIHRETASQIWGSPLSAVSDEERRRAKAINFGIIYGQGAFGLGRALKIGQGVARDFIQRYFERFPGVKKFMEETPQKAKREGLVATLHGRRRYLPEINSSNALRRQEAERVAINTTIQGTAADLMKIAMLRVWRRLGAEGLAAKIVLQVHDELIVECPDAEVEAAQAILREEMTLAGATPFYPGAPTLAVPLKVDVASSQSWARA
ncbi:MAG: DNA polymerase I [Deltaproteobacteria bacterium]|jgi:DNA polymerase-1|nr:DNA polymerase I [Deltaproteobacteria bacterium]